MMTKKKPTAQQLLSDLLKGRLAKSPELAAKQRRLLEKLKVPAGPPMPMWPVRASDPVLERLKARGPVTLKSYLEYAYPEGPPMPFPGELFEGIPRELLEPLSQYEIAETLGWPLPAAGSRL
jgi:hypothetical protein